MTDLFKQLAELATDKLQLGIAITVEKNDVVMTITPKTTKSWKPFVIQGKAEELDAAFQQELDNFKAGVQVITGGNYAETVKAEAQEKSAEAKTEPVKTTHAGSSAKHKSAKKKSKPTLKSSPTVIASGSATPAQDDDDNDDNENDENNDNTDNENNDNQQAQHEPEVQPEVIPPLQEEPKEEEQPSLFD